MTRPEIIKACLALCETWLGRKGRLIDLGAGHCQIALFTHQLGWKTTALDARTIRKPSLPDGLEFIEASVNSDDWSPENYDVILCCGLYYHLDQNMQHQLLRRCCGKHLLLDTHYSHADGHSDGFSHMLTPIEKKGKELGSIFSETPKLSDEERRLTGERASFENTTSWWPTRSSLVKTLRENSWRDVWIMDGPNGESIQRAYFFCPGN